MNIPRVLGHAAVAGAASTVWLTGVNLAPGDPPAIVQALVILPWLVASLSFALAHHVDTLTTRRPARRPVEHVGPTVMYSPRAVDARRPLPVTTATRPATRRELAR